MELKRHLDWKSLFAGIYFLALAIYLFFGLQPAEAVQGDYDATLIIPSISLESPVTELQLVNHELKTPDTIVGSFSNHKNKTLLIGHSTTVFSALKDIQLEETINYKDSTYRVIKTETLEKKDVNMKQILSESEDDTLILMTCAGELLDDGDATHRFIVEATKSS